MGSFSVFNGGWGCTQEKEVDPQAVAFNRVEKFNQPLFVKLGELGISCV